MVNKSKKIEVNEIIKPVIINGLDLTFSSFLSLFSEEGEFLSVFLSILLIKSNLLRLKGGIIGGLFALILISGIFASSTIALGSLVYAYRLKKKSNSDDNQMQDLETVNV